MKNRKVSPLGLICKKIMKVIDPVITYIFLMLGGTITWLFCKLFLTVEIKGKENLPTDFTGKIIAANHQTLIDSFFIITLLRSMPYYALYPSQIAWNAPEFSNYFKTWLLKFIFRHLRCLPVRRGKMAPEMLNEFQGRVQKILKHGCLLIFFEQTRTRDVNGTIGPAKSGLGRMVCASCCQVIPVKIERFNKILPVGSGWPRVSLHKTKVSITIGPTMTFEQEIKQNNGQMTWLKISNLVRDTVIAL